MQPGSFDDDSLARSAAASAARVQQCRIRAAELHQGLCDASDVDRARTHLELARLRAEQSRQRLLHAQARLLSRREAHRTGVAPIADPDVRERASGRPPAVVYAAYLAAGGAFGELEIDAFLHGLQDLPALEVAALAQALWELDRF